MLDGSLMTMEMTADLMWKKPHHHHHEKSSYQGYYSRNTVMNPCKDDSEVRVKL